MLRLGRRPALDSGRRARCSCADFAARGLFCKHIGVCGCGP
ncbi:SWIM zinc finger family protein [Desulfofundulus luciae]